MAAVKATDMYLSPPAGGTVLAKNLYGRVCGVALERTDTKKGTRMSGIRIAIAIIAACAVLAGAAHGQSTARIEAEQLFVDAQKALARGDDAAAESLLQKSLRRDGSFTSAIWQLAQIYEKRGQLEKARELIIKGLQQEPDAVWAREKLDRMEGVLTRRLLKEAESLMSAGKYEQAIPKLSLYMGIKPYDPLPLIRIARCHLALGNLEQAREFLVQASERDPSSTEVASLLDEVDRRVARSAVDEAVADARAVLASYTPQDRDRAMEALRAVLALDPSNAWAAAELDRLSAPPPAPKPAEPVARQNAETEEPDREPLLRAGGGGAGRVAIFVLLAAVLVGSGLLAADLRARRRQRGYALQGSISLLPLIDIVSLLNGNLKSGRLAVSGPGAHGELYFQRGEIVHARLKGTEDGRGAFFRLMELRSGRYVFHNHLPNVKHTISDPLSILLLSMKSESQKRSSGRKARDNELDKILT
jgi:tetratricopeptide (TPR) repeat protein